MRRILGVLWRELLRARMRMTLRRQARIPLRRAIALWALSDVIYLGPTGAGAWRMPEYKLYRSYCSSGFPSNEDLEALLTHPSPSVAGYAFEILMARGSEKLPEALETLRPRKSMVAMGYTSFIVYEELGTFVHSRYEAMKRGNLHTPSE